MTGAAPTVTTKVSLAVETPSPPVTVIVAVPTWLATGVTVTVRFTPVPPTTTLAIGTKVGLLLLTVTVSSSKAGTAKALTTAMCCILLAPLSPESTGLTELSGVNFRLSKTNP